MPNPTPEVIDVESGVPGAHATISIGADPDDHDGNGVAGDVVYDAEGNPYVLPDGLDDRMTDEQDPFATVYPQAPQSSPTWQGPPQNWQLPQAPGLTPPWSPTPAPVPAPTFAVRPTPQGDHIAVISIPTKDGRTITARGRAKDARTATKAAVAVASKAVDNKMVMAILPIQAQIAIRVASGLVHMYEDGKLQQYAGALKGGLKKLASIFD